MSHRTAAITFAGVLVGFKIWSFILIYWVAGGHGTTEFLLGTHVLWLLIPAALLWAPAMFWFRLVRVRRRRRKLQEAEWNVPRPPARR